MSTQLAVESTLESGEAESTVGNQEWGESSQARPIGCRQSGGKIAMPAHKKRDPHPPAIVEPEELDPAQFPVDPGEIIVPTHIPEDEERGRLIDPEDREPSKATGRGKLRQ